MTRDEAVKAIADSNRKRPGYCGLVSYESDAETFVDNLIAIGMLDEPMSGQQKAFEILCAHVEEITAKDIIREMVVANLEITEKKER